MPSASPEKNREYQRGWRKRHPDKARAHAHAYKGKLWAEFLAEYGGGCVGTSDGTPCQWRVVDPDALTVGHLLNDGGEHRLRIGGNNLTVLVDLRQRAWPKDEGIAVQCGSCQMIDQRREGKRSRK